MGPRVILGLLSLAGAAASAGCATAPSAAPPHWVLQPGRYEGAAAGTEYFLGAGRPCHTRTAAGRSAADDAGRNIARYVAEAFAARWFAAPGAKPLPGPGSVVGVVEELARAALASGTVHLPKPAETWIELVRRSYAGRTVVMVRAYHLYGLTPADLAAWARAAARRVPEELAAETVAARKDALKKLGAILGKFSPKDLEF